jgi:protein gp37
VRFISAEPLLGSLSGLELDGIDWLIAGGESGPRARPMHPAWVTALRDRCREAGVAFFFKQWGAHVPETSVGTAAARMVLVDASGRRRARTLAAESDRLTPMRRVGKGRAGRELEGRTWDEYPFPCRRGSPA